MQAPKPYHEERPWGEFLELTRNSPTTVKILTVKPGQSISLQRHVKRDEFWHVLSGNGIAVIGTERKDAKPETEFFIPRGSAHRLEADRDTLKVLEISFGIFEDDDIVRMEDQYGRANIKTTS